MKKIDDMEEQWGPSEAFRNVYLDQETEHEHGDGWSIVATRMRRRAIRRRVASCAAAMIPVAVLVGIGLHHDGSVSVMEPLQPAPMVADIPVTQQTIPAPTPLEYTETTTRHTDSNTYSPKATLNVSSVPVTEPEETIRMTEPEDSKKSVQVVTEPVETSKPSTSYDAFDFIEPEKTSSRHRITLGFNASMMPAGPGTAFPVMADAMLMDHSVGFEGSNSFAVTRADMSYDNAEFNHHMPVGTGLSVAVGLTDRLHLETGLNYTLLRSDVLKSGSLISDEQRLHFIGIPVRVYWKAFDLDGFSVYAGLGAQAGKCLKATLGTESFNERAIQWSASATAGMQYSLTRNIALYIQPEYSYHLNGTQLRTIYTDDHTEFSLRCGLRFSL